MNKKKIKTLIDLLTANKLTISSVESLTGGAFLSSLISVPGASKTVYGGFVTYQTKAKINLLGISEKTIDKNGVVSKEIAKEMAIFGYKKMRSDIVISFTGNAGPLKEKGIANVGDVYVGLKYKDKIKIYFFSLVGSRNDIIKNTIDKSIEILIKTIKEKK